MTNLKRNESSRYIFITGGVLSSLGKGTLAACLGALLRASDFTVRLCKIDPYINVDPGTMNPFEHGEVFVTKDGGETDLDFGHYERFTGIETSRHDSTTTGKIFLNIIERERKGAYNGQTVQIVPHFVQEVHDFLHLKKDSVDFTICEVGGTVGDIESRGFIESIRQMRLIHGIENTLYIHVVPMYYLKTTQELKSKPAQHSVQALLGYGIQPDFLCCRTSHTLEDSIKDKLATACNLPKEKIITAQDAKTVYALPSLFEKEGLLTKTFAHFNMTPRAPELSKWCNLTKRMKFVDDLSKVINIAIVGKYVSFHDTYRSLGEALWHASIYSNTKVRFHWISVDKSTPQTLSDDLTSMDGVLVPGGFGLRGLQEKILATSIACDNNIPFFGICLGMQALVLHHAKKSSVIKDPFSQEFTSNTQGTPVISLLDTWTDVTGETQKRSCAQGKLRLGNLPFTITKGTLAHTVYGTTLAYERHRHRYHTEKSILNDLAKEGLVVSGYSDDGIIECLERPDQTFCIGVQFHPEFNSSPFTPHPLFVSFINAAAQKNT